MKKYFDKPTQVKFYDEAEDNWVGGIALGGYIICGCCGAVWELSDLEDDWVVELPWIDVNEAIKGE